MTNASEDTRLKQEPLETDVRASRRSRDRTVSQNRELTDADRLEMFRKRLFNDALPDLPDIDGYHVCWLTTTNSRDSVHHRMQQGYEPVRPDEVPGMEFASIKTGDWVGFIGVNEMLAFKLPLSLYHGYMEEAHHAAPQREEDKLAETADAIRDQAERAGSAMAEGDGMSDLRRSDARAPREWG